MLLTRLSARSRHSLPILRANYPPIPRPALLSKPLPHLLSRCYVQPPPAHEKPPTPKSQPPPGNHEIPETLLIYHAGTGRTTLLAMLKATTLFVAAFFCILVAPRSDAPASLLACGLVPLFFTAYTTAPFATHIHIRLPPAARASPIALRRFVGAAPPAAMHLTVTTMSAIAKPRYSSLCAADLRPARARFGIVNWARGGAAAGERRRWFELRAVTGFCVADRPLVSQGSFGPQREGRGAARAKGGSDRTEGWIWEAVKHKIAAHEAADKPA